MSRTWKLTPKNWDRFQHYSHRTPPWIKLHRGILNDYAFSRLPVVSKALAPMLWVLASEHREGLIELTTEELSFRVHMTIEEVEQGLQSLITNGFFTDDGVTLADASNTLAECSQVATTERETEREIELVPALLSISLETPKIAAAPNGAGDGFEEFWKAYPRKVSKGAARKAWRSAMRKVDPATVIRCVLSATWKHNEYDPHPATWLNGERWLDTPTLSVNQRIAQMVGEDDFRRDEPDPLTIDMFGATDNVVRLRA